MQSSHRNLGEYVEQDRQDREVNPDPLAAESLPEILWHCENARGHVDRDEEPSEHHQVENRLEIRYYHHKSSSSEKIFSPFYREFKGCDSYARGCPRSCQAYEVTRPDVGGKQ